MNAVRRCGPITSAATAIVMILALAPNGQAQDDLLPEPAEAPQAELRVIEPPAAVPEPVSPFDLWAFAPYGSERTMRNYLEAQLSRRLSDLDRLYGLSNSQKKKLRLAGEGEIKRAFDAAAEMRQRYEAVGNDAEKLQALFVELEPEQRVLFKDLFGERSFLEKVVCKSLVGEQLAKREVVLRERALAHARECVDVLIIHETQGLGLSDRQRRELAELFHSDPGAPRDGKAPRPSFDEVIRRMSAFPESRLKAIFDERQWRVVSRRIEGARANAPNPRGRH
jgi:hypothetical protein